MHITLQSSSITTICCCVNIFNRSGRAAWLGTKIILRQVSPESEPIFDFIVHLHRSCEGNWEELRDQLSIPDDELTKFLDFAAMFLGNMGNFYVSEIPENYETRLSLTAQLMPRAMVIKNLYLVSRLIHCGSSLRPLKRPKSSWKSLSQPYLLPFQTYLVCQVRPRKALIIRLRRPSPNMRLLRLRKSRHSQAYTQRTQDL